MNLKVVTLFSGYDSQCMALDRLKEKYPDFDYELINWAEIDKYAIKAHDAVYPQWADRNLGDVSKIDWSKVPDFDLLTYSSPCFVGETQVISSNGYKMIKDLTSEDKVLTHNLEWKRVIAKGSDGKKPIWKITSMGSLPILCTKNHPFYVKRRIKVWDKTVRRWKYEFTDAYKSRVEDFEGGEYLGVPIVATTMQTEYNDELLWLVGRFIADGHINDKQVVYSIGKDKVKDFERITIEKKVYQHTQSCIRIVFRKDTLVYKAVKELTNCQHALEKAFNMCCLMLDANKVKVLLEGYMSGDGCYIEKSNAYQATTISRDLAQQLVLMIQKAYGVGVKLYKTERPSKYVIQGREVNQHDTYMVRYNLANTKKQWINDGKFVWYPVKKVEDMEYEDTIYNITVEDDHTYTANNVTCFNCQDFSNAGKMRGGEEGSGTRSSLLWEVRRAIVEKRPKYLLMENVAALVGQKFIKTFNLWQAELESYGYTNFAQVLNAKDYGIPQNRERIFMVSILDCEQAFYFPEPMPLKLRLKDVLEEKVDESYYLSDKIIQGFNAHKERHEDKGNGFAWNPTEGEGVAACVLAGGGQTNR